MDPSLIRRFGRRWSQRFSRVNSVSIVRMSLNFRKRRKNSLKPLQKWQSSYTGHKGRRPEPRLKPSPNLSPALNRRKQKKKKTLLTPTSKRSVKKAVVNKVG